MSPNFKVVKISKLNARTYFSKDMEVTDVEMYAGFVIDFPNRIEYVEVVLDDRLHLTPQDCWDKEYSFLTQEMIDKMNGLIDDNYNEVKNILEKSMEAGIKWSRMSKLRKKGKI